MTSIQCLLTLNWSRLLWPYLKRNMMPTVTASVSSVASSATHLINCSSTLGMSITTTAPTAGIRTVSVSAHESNQFIEPIPLRLREDPQREGEQPHREDQDQGIELKPTGLHAASRATRFAGRGRQTVHDTVDTALVDVFVGEP